jgi:hypothetical protein
MNAYLWFQFGSFAYGFSGKLISSQRPTSAWEHALVELDPAQNDTFDLPHFVESILETSRYLLRVDVCFWLPHDFKGQNEVRLFTRHLPELVVSNNKVKLKLTDLEVKTNPVKPNQLKGLNFV